MHFGCLINVTICIQWQNHISPSITTVFSLSAKSMLSQHYTQLWISFHMHNLIAKDLITEKSNVCSFIFNRWFNFVFKNDLENLCIKHESQTNLVILLHNSTDRRQNFAISNDLNMCNLLSSQSNHFDIYFSHNSSSKITWKKWPESAKLWMFRDWRKNFTQKRGMSSEITFSQHWP